MKWNVIFALPNYFMAITSCCFTALKHYPVLRKSLKPKVDWVVVLHLILASDSLEHKICWSRLSLSKLKCDNMQMSLKLPALCSRIGHNVCLSVNRFVCLSLRLSTCFYHLVYCHFPSSSSPFPIWAVWDSFCANHYSPLLSHPQFRSFSTFLTNIIYNPQCYHPSMPVSTF